MWRRLVAYGSSGLEEREQENELVGRGERHRHVCARGVAGGRTVGVRGGGGGGGGIERGEVQWGVGLEGWPGWVTSRGSSELGRLWRA